MQAPDRSCARRNIGGARLPAKPSTAVMELPVRLSTDATIATWNPALTRAAHVVLHVRVAAGGLEARRTMNSGRARVRTGERIEAVVVPAAGTEREG
jgi:hypothetical protein